MTLPGSYDGSPGVPPLRFLNIARIPPRPGGAPASAAMRNIRLAAAGEEARRAHLLRTWRPVLERLALPGEVAAGAAARALAADTRFVHELLASGALAEEELFGAVAAELGLGFVREVDPAALLVDEDTRLKSLRARHGLRIAMVKRPDGTTLHLVADPAIDLAQMRALLARAPHLRAKLRIAPPSALRAAIVARSSRRLLFDAQHDLLLRSPEFSAHTVVNAWQGAVAVAAVFAFLLVLWLAPVPTLLVFNLVASAGFAVCVGLRLLALLDARPPRVKRLPPPDPAEQPVYSVLVALYRESEVVPQLLAALGRLRWPRARLEIKLVCEADDDATLAELERCGLRPGMEVVLVPPGLPRTKPKALAYALPLCSGEFVTLYDAEDRPDPQQLVEAWTRFRAEPPRVACLQAPLAITNGRASPLSAMFSFEYAGLFRGLVPWLARRGLALPLGGTSNHFRREALEKVGGWDPFNVTEDADLGLRLARYGYRTGVVASPTYEEAPETLAVWLPQRTRWFKGWMQTWLVHMREPATLWRDLGPASFVAMQVMSLGMIASALVHPVFLASILYTAARLVLGGDLARGESLIAAIGLANVVAGYGAFIALGLATLVAAEKPRPLLFVLLTPLHWVLLSVAAWKALWELYRRPHHWSKTPHGRPARERPEA